MSRSEESCCTSPVTIRFSSGCPERSTILAMNHSHDGSVSRIVILAIDHSGDLPVEMSSYCFQTSMFLESISAPFFAEKVIP